MGVGWGGGEHVSSLSNYSVAILIFCLSCLFPIDPKGRFLMPILFNNFHFNIFFSLFMLYA